MTLEEAIKHCKEKACGNTQCALEHQQLAEWLQELQQYRKNARKEQPEVDLEEEYKTWWNSISGKINIEHMMEWYMHETARHFFELGLNARKEKSL